MIGTDPARGAAIGAAVLHGAVAASLCGAALTSGEPSAWTAAAVAGAAIPAWAHVASTRRAASRIAALRGEVADRERAGATPRRDLFGPAGPEADLALAEQELAHLRGPVAARAAAATAAISAAGAAVPFVGTLVGIPAEPVLPGGSAAAISLTMIGGIVIASAMRYVRALAQSQEGADLLPGAGLTAAAFPALIAAGAAVALRAADASGAARVAAILVAVGAAALAAEIAAGLALAFARPRTPGESSPPPYRTRLVGALAAGSGPGRAIRDAFEHQLGFDPSGSRLLAEAGRLAPRLAGAGVAAVWALTCVEIVRPWESGVRVRGGRIAGIEGPGLVLGFPWPFDEVLHVDVAGLRRVHVGSHVPAAADAEVYRPDEPVLWSTRHGTGDEILLVAAHTDDTAAEATRRAPTVSLFGADVRVEYRVADAAAWVRHRAPDEHFAHLAARAAQQELARYDVDSLLGADRARACDAIAAAAQSAADAAGLGIAVTGAEMSGVHPPQPASSSFHDTVIAAQEKAARIEAAERDATAIFAGVAGSRETAARILGLIDRAEAGDASAIREAEAIAGDAGGRAAELLADARVWRWTRAAAEASRAAVFRRESLLARTAPRLWREGAVADAVARALSRGGRTVLLAHPDELVVRVRGGTPQGDSK